MSKGHHAANKDGYVYEHIVAAEKKLGRELEPGETVHHIDQDKRNNALNNLMVFKSNSDHIGYHHGNKAYQLPDGSWKTINKSKNENGRRISLINEKECIVCGAKFKSVFNEAKYCSPNCVHYGQRRCPRPTKEELLRDIQSSSFVQLGRKYGVSDSAIKKWCKAYGLSYLRKEIKAMKVTI